MAAAFFNRMADPTRTQAQSAGTDPAAHVHPEVVAAMRELGFDLSAVQPQKLTPELAAGAEMLITMGCGERCPHLPGVERADWPLMDPKGKDLAAVQTVRDEIARRVEQLIREKGLR
jgi:arsenate reductase